jgi:methylated-DNA-[protein]-cysteine S-methyltransferase
MGTKMSDEQGSTWIVETSLGRLRIEIDDQERLVAMTFAESRERVNQGKLPAIIATLKAQLEEYAAGTRKEIDVPLASGVPRGTHFERSVWRLTARIRAGETRTYGEIAKELGSPNASRAVGAALGRNPLPFIVPCHRVVGSTGKLTGYAGGVELKKRLLEVEGKAGLFSDIR